jgi:hypothetical protein
MDILAVGAFDAKTVEDSAESNTNSADDCISEK